MGAQSGSRQREVGLIASRQHGVIGRRQLLEIGMTRRTISRWLENGRLHREFPGVYRVGHKAPSVEARFMAAVVAAGEGALLCGLAAAYIWGLLGRSQPFPEVLSLRNRAIRGVITHRARHIDPADRKHHRGIPVTSVERTLVDLAAVLCLDALARASHEAEARHGTSARDVAAVLARRPRAPGTPKLRSIYVGDAHVILSRLERDFLDVLLEERLPLPVTNRRKGSYYVDCRWEQYRLTVELDGFQFHHSRHAWERDRDRERQAHARGDRFRRYTWADVHETRARTVADLDKLLPRLPVATATLASPRRDSSVGRARD
jgi:very-short-patch-repair endonuclease